jgi:endonuclease YncB( thermonuclease family)
MPDRGPQPRRKRAMDDKLAKRLLLCAWTVLAAGDAAAQGRPASAGCATDVAGTGTVGAVLDGRTFRLTDGRQVRLAAIEVAAGDAAAQSGKASLEAAIGGRMVVLKRHGAGIDRHGRLLSFAFATGHDRSAQEILLAAGHARVAGPAGGEGCAAALLAIEREARGASRGLWADPSYAPRRSDDPAAVLGQRGRYTLVEGKVLSVRESGGVIYVNFGRRWSEDFTATVLRRNERSLTASGLKLRSLGGRTVRVRGVVEERGGPWIEITRPEQIEILAGN